MFHINTFNILINNTICAENNKTLENFLMKTAEAMEKMRRIEGRVATDQVKILFLRAPQLPLGGVKS